MSDSTHRSGGKTLPQTRHRSATDRKPESLGWPTCTARSQHARVHARHVPGKQPCLEKAPYPVEKDDGTLSGERVELCFVYQCLPSQWFVLSMEGGIVAEGTNVIET